METKGVYKKVIIVLLYTAQVPFIFMCGLLVIVFWLNRILIIPFYIRKYGMKTFNRYISDCMSFTNDLIGLF